MLRNLVYPVRLIKKVFEVGDTCISWMDISEIIRVKTLIASPRPLPFL